MKLKIIIVLLIGMAIATQTEAQQEPMFTKYMFNSLILNPGFTGSHLGVKASATYRHQWAGFEGAPRTFWVGGDAAFGDNKSTRFGINLGHDETGVNTLSAIFLNYAYGITLSREAEIAIGIKAGGYLFGSKPGTLLNVDFTDPLYASNTNSFIPTFGTGIYYHYADQFYLGASIPTLAAVYPSTGTAVSNGFFKRHYYLHGGYMIKFGGGREQNKLKLTGLVKFQPAAPVQFDIGATYYTDFNLGFGISYRSNDALSANIEIPIGENIFIGYAYDFTLTSVRKYSNGVHEIMVGYLKPGKNLGINTPTQWFR